MLPRTGFHVASVHPILLRFPVRIGRGGTCLRSAILSTMIESALRAGHDSEAWLADVLIRIRFTADAPRATDRP